MASIDSKVLSAEALLTLFAGLALASCQKSSPELAAEVSQAAASGAPRASATPKSAAVGAREVPSAAGSAKVEKEGGCSPGGCAPGQCAGSKKE
jgi:hypothetical protein